MSRRALLQSIISEYGIPWAVNRALYSCKLKTMRTLPKSEQFFETKKNIALQRIDVFQIDVHAITEFLQELPDEAKAQLLASADDACEGRIRGFSSVPLDYGNPINWQLNPLTGKSCDASVKWYRIPDFDQERGDIKVIWEISRFSHFYTLSRAYLMTSDVKYYRAFSQQLSNWLQENPYSYGANYKCGQECALRLINGLMAYAVFKNAGVSTAPDEDNVKDMVSRCYRKILSNFFYAYRCIKNNHTISELVGMIIGAWCCGDKEQVKKAYGLLDEVICEQFAADGGYTQFSFNYQRLALQDIECVMSLNTGYHLSVDATERAKQSTLLMYQCQSESGDVPNYGSNDGALIFPVTSCGYRDFRPTLNCIHALTSGTRLYPAGLYDEELLWFAGGIDKYRVDHLTRQSEQYPDAGLYTIRSDSSFLMTILNDYKTRPAHMDQFHFDLWINGVNVLCDSGTYSYASELGAELAATGGHNTVKVTGVEQMTKRGAFMLCGWTKREVVKWTENSFTGVVMSKNGYMHRRKFIADESCYSITDEVETSGQDTKAVDVLFHTPCDVEKTETGVVLSYQGRTICSIASDNAEIKIETAERSLYYLKSEPIKLIKLSTTSVNGKVKIESQIEINRWNRK